MKITIESTPKIVELTDEATGNRMNARVWMGQTEDGIPVQCFITRIAPEVHRDDPEIDAKTRQFETDLLRMADPRPGELKDIPTRMVI